MFSKSDFCLLLLKNYSCFFSTSKLFCKTEKTMMTTTSAPKKGKTKNHKFFAVRDQNTVHGQEKGKKKSADKIFLLPKSKAAIC